MHKENKNIFGEQAGVEDIKLFSHFAAALFGMLKGAHLYPKGHQMLRAVVENFLTSLKDVLAQNKIVTLRIFENNLFVLNARIDPEKTAGVDGFVEEMQKRYIRQIIFNTSTNTTDINALIEALKLPPENITINDGARAVLESNGARGIKIIEYYSRRNTAFDPEQLLSLTNSEIFRFFTDETQQELNPEHTHLLYELLKESALMCALIKVAVQYILRNASSGEKESNVILRIMRKIKNSIMSISEETETKTILQDIISSFDKETFFSLIFENRTDEIILYTDAFALFSKQTDIKTTADLLTQKILNSKQNREFISQVKQTLQNLFADRKTFLSFLPVFKETLLQKHPHQDKALTILNEICDAFTPGFSLEDDVALSLGAILGSERQDIVNGMEILKTVAVEKEAISAAILNYDIEENYVFILQTLLVKERALEIFQKILDKLLSAIESAIKDGAASRGRRMMLALSENLAQCTDKRSFQEQKIIAALNSIPAPIIEKLIINTLTTCKDEDIRQSLSRFFALFNENLFSLLLNIYLGTKDLPNIPLVRNLIAAHYKKTSLMPPINLRREQPSRMMRLLELLEEINDEQIVPLLGEITFHNNPLVTQRALKILAEQRSGAALAEMMKVLAHPSLPLRITAIEYLAQFRYKQVLSALTVIAFSKEKTAAGEEDRLKLRKAALKSIIALDISAAKAVLKRILNKKKLFFLAAEPKALRVFAREHLGLLHK
ncbi:MAG: HEAT repeat domain-containing protein [Candidatus Omnitrophica bacterium]|nr:HEAT repeat domain-containing protein [Candidatus Omnitrophota bacterium]MBU4478051.1 HEAT repeat domain-containing protein [Candidatus Omnitrophota bacterium]